MKCPEKFEDMLDHQFIARLDDKRKINLVQIYLGASKLTVKYTDAKQAFEKAYQQFGMPSLFNNLHSQSFSPPAILVQSELVSFLQALRVPLSAPIQDNSPY